MVPTCSGSYADTNVANPAKARLSPLGTSREFSYIVVTCKRGRVSSNESAQGAKVLTATAARNGNIGAVRLRPVKWTRRHQRLDCE
jgi:hypothetical protein